MADLLVALSAVSTVWFRKNGIMFLIVASCCFALYEKRLRKEIGIYLLCGMAAMAFNNYYMNKLNIADGPVKEMLSVPLQQTARTVKYHGEEFTESEKNYLCEIFHVNSTDEIAMAYNPEISDPVKELFLSQPDRKDLIEYAEFWLDGCIKYPQTYAMAFILHTYGYFDLLREDFWEGIGVYGKYYDDYQSAYIQGGTSFHINYSEATKKTRAALEEFDLFISKIPLVRLFYRCGIYTWVLIYGIGYSVHIRKPREILFLIPLLFSVLICILSPVNALLRYQLPVMECTPIVIAWIFRQQKKPVDLNGEGIVE